MKAESVSPTPMNKYVPLDVEPTENKDNFLNYIKQRTTLRTKDNIVVDDVEKSKKICIWRIRITFVKIVN